MQLAPALRSLARSPGFTAAALVTFALATGAAIAIFAVIDATMLRPLDYPAADRLVRVWETTPRGDDFVASEPNYLDFRDRNRSFEALAAFKQAPLSLTGSGEPRRLQGYAITGELFPLLGQRPAIGRNFLAEESLPGGDPRVAILSHTLWMESFGGSRDILGATITLDRASFTVVGVMPPSSDFPDGDLWIPLAPDPGSERGDHWLELVGRLHPGVTPEMAAVDLAGIAATFGEMDPAIAGWGARVEPFADWLVGSRFRRTMMVLFGAVGCLLLIGCLNLANLLLARGSARQIEVGIRSALGASPGRIVRQLLAESVIISAAGSLLGLLAASWALHLLRLRAPTGIPRIDEIGIDARVFAFATVLALVTAAAFGLAPALAAARQEIGAVLRGSRSTPNAHQRARAALVVVQIAFAAVLLVGAGLLLRSFLALQQADPGFDPVNVVAVPLQLDGEAYREPWQKVGFIEELTESVTALPGVESAAAVAVDPFSGWNLVNDVTPAERAVEVGPSGLFQAAWRTVTPDFFRTMGIPLLEGRDFEDADRDPAPQVAIISATLAERLWPGEPAVGKRLFWGGTDGTPKTVVGVVGDYEDVALERDPTPVLFLPNNQIGWPSMTLMVRSSGDGTALASAIREQVRTVDPLLPVPEVRPLDRSMREAYAGPRFRSTLVGVFAVIAIVLAGVGVYGVTAFGVVRRRREFGIRLALGATPGTVTRQVMRGGAHLTALGLLFGLVGGWILSRSMESLLYGVAPNDAPTFTAVLLILGGSALLASYLPGRRAAQADPMMSLRQE